MEDLQLSILGLGVQYPAYSLPPSAISDLARRHYGDSPAMTRVLHVNEKTGITTRSSVVEMSESLLNQPTPPTIAEIHQQYMAKGLPLATSACRKALAEASLGPSDITHIVATTCTDSANPGYDHFVAEELALPSNVERVLLHGVGCAGGLAVLRTAANLALGHSFRGKPARVLCVALELNTTLVRSELDSIHGLQQSRIGVCLFSDCASAVVLSNGVGGRHERPVYSLMGWNHRRLPGTDQELGFDVDPQGWKVILTPKVPGLTAGALPSSFADLVRDAARQLPPGYREAADFDWAIHPGGAKILENAAKGLGISREHMWASQDVYENHGNSSSATIFSVLDRLRQGKDEAGRSHGGRKEGRGGRQFVVGCAFGPGITVETCMLQRHRSTSRVPKGHDDVSPPESKAEAGSSGPRRRRIFRGSLWRKVQSLCC
ncbi:type Iii polyketide synthase [Microdochium bolleyi]|uniref:Type Iii polyketide synthase n=1 Tax=Microdochium bolleyi TaxID=196109 RepID=A0A136IT12_9PEZI|nr:type Iii polyketide synthase [Microdochium bolleyi]